MTLPFAQKKVRQLSIILLTVRSRLREAVSTTVTATMLSLFAIIGCLVALYLARFPYNLARNYIAARKLGLPIIIVPIDQHHIIWMLISVPLRPVFKVCNSGSAHIHDCYQNGDTCRQRY
jgi:hypothetical protein